MPSRVLPSGQLSLDLNRSLLTIPVAVPEEAVSALADLRGRSAPIMARSVRHSEGFVGR